MTKKLAVALFAVVAICAGKATAAPDFTPTEVGCTSSGNCFVRVTPALTSAQTACSGKTEFRFPLSSPGAEGWYQAALAAVASGRKINVQATDVCVDNFSCPLWLFTK